MNNKQYLRMTATQLKGRKVRLLRDIRTGSMVIPKGSICTIQDKYSGLELDGPACTHCGVRVIVRKVAPQDVDLLYDAQAKPLTGLYTTTICFCGHPVEEHWEGGGNVTFCMTEHCTCQKFTQRIPPVSQALWYAIQHPDIIKGGTL